VRLGARTATGDAEGEMLERRPVDVTDARIEGVLATFRGRILQTPPMYSALKQGGQPLYRLARQGRSVERDPRPVEIYRLELRKRDGELVELLVRCSKGTYIRTLAEDIGSALGTGAHLAGLRRTAAGGFRVEDAVGLDALQSLDAQGRTRLLLPPERLVADLPRVDLDTDAAERFRMGQTVFRPGLEAGPCAVFRSGLGLLIGVGEIEGGGGLRPRRLVAAAPVEGATG
jgi:tRNA pseudouridine55 synthase